LTNALLRFPETLEVDGVERSTYDAKGRLVALDLQGVQAFWRFYRDGPVDHRGRPIVVYHGTKSDIDAYDIKKFGTTDEGLVGKGFYFTYNPEEASGYALSEVYGKGDSPNVQPVYVALQNPFVIKLGVLPDGRRIQEVHGGIGVTGRGGGVIRKLAEDAGHDGIVWANKDGKVLHVTAWSPDQIKSAVGNPGTYRRSSPSVTDGFEVTLGFKVGLPEIQNEQTEKTSSKARKRFGP
jgi:hypothetical protein